MSTIKIRGLKKAYLEPKTYIQKVILNNNQPEIQRPDFSVSEDGIEILNHSISPPELITNTPPLPPISVQTAKKILEKIPLNLVKTPKNKLFFEPIICSAQKTKIELRYPIYKGDLPRNQENIYQAIEKKFPLLERKHIFLSRYFPNFPVSHVKKLQVEQKSLCGEFIFNDEPMQTCALIFFVDGIKRRSHHLIIPNKISE